MRRIASVLVLIALLISACAQEQLPRKPAPAPATPPAAGQNETSGAPAEERPALLRPEFERLLNASARAQFTATYDEEATDPAGVLEQTSVTIYRQGRLERTDRRIAFGNESVELRTIVSAERVVSCANDGKWSCFSLPGVNATALPDESFWRATAISAGGQRTVAGVSGACYSLVTRHEQGTVTQLSCYSSDGIPLLVDTAVAAEGLEHRIILTARSVKRSVASGAFEPPAKVEEGVSPAALAR